eukprot:1328322-Amphidinium_carterae.2
MGTTGAHAVEDVDKTSQEGPSQSAATSDPYMDATAKKRGRPKKDEYESTGSIVKTKQAASPEAAT